ncbi:MAG: hypothetical protein JST46_05325 [Bacteroidetes bacterium]|nr:hypothetical protein [Bacteroidota bacterium]
MKTFNFLKAALAVASLLALLTGCTSKKATQDTPSLGQVTVSTTAIEPDVYFQGAIKAFTENNYAETAQAIGQACDYMISIKGLSSDKFQQNLDNSISELRELQNNVKSDKVDGLDELNYFFARAGNALAGVHMNVTESISFNVKGPDAGKELMKAVASIRSMVNYHHYEFDAEENALLGEIEAMAKRLEKSEPVTKEELDAKFKLLGTHLTKWGNDIEVSYSGSHKKGVIHNEF